MGLSRQEYWSGVPLSSSLLCYHITKKNTWVVNNSDLLPVPKSLMKQLIRCTILDAWGWCTGTTQRMVRGGRREDGSGWGTRVYLWWIHVDVWQNQYNIVKLKNKIKKKTVDIFIGGRDKGMYAITYIPFTLYELCHFIDIKFL